MYTVADKVLKYNRRHETRMGDKLGLRYTGPYEIHEIIGNGCYRLSDKGKVLHQTANAANLKGWHEQVSPSQSPKTSPHSSHKRPQGKAKRNLTSTLLPPVSSPIRPDVWIPELNLTRADEAILMGHEWLNDRLMDAVNKLAATHAGLDESQTTLNAQVPSGFKPLDNESMQIIHDRDHWVAVATMGGEVLFADSLNRGISDYVIAQLKELYKRNIDLDGCLSVTKVQCDQQTNSADCGLYAAAFVFEWATCSSNLQCGFVCGSMREHLRRCLVESRVIPFPRQRKSGRSTHHPHISKEKVVVKV